MAARIVWTDQETQTVTRETLKQRLANPTPGLLTCILKAQRLVLPPGRRRKIKALSNARPVVQAIEAAFSVLREFHPEMSDEQSHWGLSRERTTDEFIAITIAFLLHHAPGAETHLRNARQRLTALANRANPARQ